MKTKQFLVLIIGICVLAWMSALVLNHLEGIEDHDFPPRVHERSSKPPFPGDKARFIHWFLQISDIHISKFWDPKRTPDLKKFCTENIEVIRPEVVLATGDLTDAKHANFMGSEQFVEEWQLYYQTLVASKVMEKTVWLDVKGNHDVFNVPSLTSQENYFRQYSAQGKSHLSSYKYVHKTSDGQEFSFVAVDATPIPGIKRPFNFFGVLSDDSVKQLKKYGEESRSSNMTIWFGHYPTSVLANPRPLREMLRNSGNTVYLSGHLHTLANLVPSMYAKGRQGFLELELGDWLDNRLHVGASVYLSGHLHTLNGQMERMYAHHPWPGHLELELGDWKDNRIYRLMAVDHDMYSFIDVRLGEWPLVLITNPKDAQFITPSHEPTGRMKRSTHIRILAFSPSPIKEVTVILDGEPVGSAHPVADNLYVLPWDPNKYPSGLHQIQVVVKDEAGHTKEVDQQFTLDDTQLPFEFWRKVILLCEQAFVIKMLFTAAFTGLTFVLTAVRIYSRRATVGGVTHGNILYRIIHTWLRRLYMLCTTPRVFWPLMAYHVYIAIGPWFVGHFTDKNVGVMFVFGIIVNGTFVPALLTWAYGFIQLIMFNIPLTLYLARLIDVTVTASCRPPVERSKLCAVLHHIKEHGFLYTILLLEAWFAYGGFYLAYGIYSLIFGPVRSWSILLALFLQRIALQARSAHYKPKHMEAVANGVSAQSADR